MKTLKLLSASLIALTSHSVLAHPGHDHAHWLSSPVHVITAVALSAAVVLLVATFVKKRKKQMD